MKIEKNYIEKGINFLDFQKSAEIISAEPEKYLGNFSKEHIGYTKLNITRSSRIFKKWKNYKFDNLNQLIDKVVIISEPWCGDAAQSVPIIAACTTYNNISLFIIPRDVNIELLKKVSDTNSLSIPIALFLDSNNEILFKWGPRPSSIQKYVIDNIHNVDSNKEEILKKTQLLYNQDKGAEILKEIYELSENLNK